VVKCLGILRELQNSPNRISDDELILKAVMENLELQRVEVTLLKPEAADAADISRFDMIIPMCETSARLSRLDKLARPGGPLVINPAASVLNCYRTNMIPRFEKTPDLVFPQTEIYKVTNVPPSVEGGVWLKRGDVHNTCSHDVVYARNRADVDAILDDFEKREISDVVVQRHIDGDLIKFYGVGPGQWFTWFYHDPATARRLSFELEDLAYQAETAARTVELEIFGGDAIVSPDGPIYIIDINSWPSFARVRSEAAVQIARRLRARLRRREAARKA
jgi:glutathione synthase/RimK-type ligase-like ATP-grasp enzyme